jgi:hypothetical protein
MIRSRTAQLIYQSFSLGIAFIGLVASFGFFERVFRWDFYIHFTNLSNYLCIAFLTAELVQTARKREDSFVTVFPVLKFIAMLGILLTFLVYNLLLAKDAAANNPVANFKINCVTFHVLIPLLFTADWFLFYERKKVKWTYPLLSALMPLIYLVFVFLHAMFRHFDSSIANWNKTGPFIYPYFFLDPAKQGVQGIALWCLLLLVLFVVGGFLLMGLDHLLSSPQED